MQQVLDEIIRLSEPKSDHRYEEYEGLVELRQQLVDQLKENIHLLSKEQKGYIHQILSYDTLILERMAAYKLEAEEALQAIKIAKRQRNTYDTPDFNEGFLFDEKK